MPATSITLAVQPAGNSPAGAYVENAASGPRAMTVNAFKMPRSRSIQ